MKTTLMIEDSLMRALKAEAARQKTTISELVSSALRLLLNNRQKKINPPLSLPSFEGGVPLVDISNREALYQVMEER